jgi:hypothetical protein
MLALMKLLSFPIMLLNLLGGVVSGLWLAILGQWGAIGVGLLAMLAGGFGISIALLPSMLFAAPAAYFERRGIKPGAYFFGLLSVLYIYALMAWWCITILVYFANRADASSYIPMVLWSYGVAMGPWSWLAQKDQGNWASGISMFFAQVGYIVMMIMVLLLNVTVGDVMAVFAVIMLIGLIVQFKMVLTIQRLMRHSPGGSSPV